MTSFNKPVTSRSEAWVCGRSLAGIVPIPTGGMDVCFVLMLCFGQVEGADPSSRGVVPSVCVSLSVIRCDSNPLRLQ